MFRKLATVIAVSAALSSPSVWALGLGEIDNSSSLNQPLQAKIKLLSSKDFAEKDLNARIASFEAYSKFGVAKDSLHNQISFNTVTLADGSKVIEVSTKSRVREPYLNFLVELSWPQGRLLREYTLLLDPPVFNKTLEAVATPAPKVKPVVPKVGRTTTDPRQLEDAREVTLPQKDKSDTRSEQITITQQPAQVRRAATSFSGNNWTVKRGDTLWAIAQRVKPEGVSVQQTLISLYRNNPRAFINNDIDRLMAGVKLSVPASAEIGQVSKNISLAELRRESGSTSAPLDVRKTVEETNLDNTVSQGGRLTIASVDKNSLESAGSSSVADTSEELQSEIDNLREAVETLKLQNQQLQDELVSKDVNDESGLAVADDTLALISGSAEAAEGTLEAIDASPEVEEAQIAQTEDSNPASSPELSTELQDEVKEKAVEKEVPVENTKVATTNNNFVEKRFWEKENFFIWLGGALAALLAATGAFFFIKKVRSDSEEELDSGFSDRAFNQNEPKQSFLDKDDMNAPEEDTDPSVEADILIARGKLSESEELLEKALENDAGNDTVRVKLLEVYASQQKIEEFEQLKQTLPEGFDHDSELGLKVASLVGLLGATQTSSDASSLLEDSGIELPTEGDIFGDDSLISDTVGEVEEIDLSEELEQKESDLEFDSIIDNPKDSASEEASDKALSDDSDAKQKELNDDGSIDFSSSLADFEAEVIDTIEEDSLEEAAEEAVEDIEQSLDSNSIEFDLTNAKQAAPEDDSSEDKPGLSDDEAETKLELAKAYIEMGDEEAAKDILTEVIKEGSGVQSDEAESLLANI